MFWILTCSLLAHDASAAKSNAFSHIEERINLIQEQYGVQSKFKQFGKPDLFDKTAEYPHARLFNLFNQEKTKHYEAEAGKLEATRNSKNSNLKQTADKLDDTTATTTVPPHKKSYFRARATNHHKRRQQLQLHKESEGKTRKLASKGDTFHLRHQKLMVTLTKSIVEKNRNYYEDEDDYYYEYYDDDYENNFVCAAETSSDPLLETFDNNPFFWYYAPDNDNDDVNDDYYDDYEYDYDDDDEYYIENDDFYDDCYDDYDDYDDDDEYYIEDDEDDDDEDDEDEDDDYGGNPYKDFSSFFECDNNLNCDAAGLLDVMKAPCLMSGGVLYSVDFDLTCQAGDNQEMWNATNLPLCLGRSCDVNGKVDDAYHYCAPTDETLNFEYNIEQVESMVTDECFYEGALISEEAGTGDPGYIWEYIEDADDYLYDTICTSSNDTSFYEVCDFEPLHRRFKGACEAEGGKLYQYSHSFSVTTDEGNMEFVSSLDIPLCVASSCDAETIFESVVTGLWEFYLDGDFGNNVYSNYTLDSYNPILEVDTSPTPMPTEYVYTCEEDTERIGLFSKGVGYIYKDFSSLIECDDVSCDNSGVLEEFMVPCQFRGGVMYSVNIDSNCIDKVFEEKNIPVCLGPSCSVSEWIDKILLQLDDPETCSYESNVEEMELTFSDECHDDFGTLSEAAGYGDPRHVFEYMSNGFLYDTVCSIATDIVNGTFETFETCDFESMIEVFQGPCEEEGGLMYTYTYALELNTSNYVEDVYNGTDSYWVNLTFEGEYLNAPICVTSSCHGEDYFEAGIFRYLDFLLDVTFMGGAQEHTPIEYTLISDLPMPHTATPTVTQSEAPSTAPGSKKKKSKKLKTSKKKKKHKAPKMKKSKGSKSM